MSVSGKRLRIIALAGGLLAVLMFVAVQGWRQQKDGNTMVDPIPDLHGHPIYRNYEFGADDSVIDMGIQPMWLPTGIISELMRRDGILHAALSRQGLKIRFHPFLKGADVNHCLFRGDLEVGIGGDMPALVAASNGKGHIAALIQLGFSSVVAKRHMLISELRGKRIGYAWGSNAHYALLQTLASAGLKQVDVTLVQLEVIDMPEALEANRIDAFSAWEPTPTIALTRYKDQVVIHRSLTSGYLYFSAAFASRYPQAIEQIVASELRAINWMRRKDRNLLTASRWALSVGEVFSGHKSILVPEQYATLAKNDLLGVASAVIPYNEFTVGGRLFREFEFLKSIDKIPAEADWAQVKTHFDRSLVKDIISQWKRYRIYTYEYSTGSSPGPDAG